MVIKEIEVKDIMTITNLPVSDYAVNPYVGCTHACKYCYASFMKRFTNHPEPWGEFVDIKNWPEINKPGKFTGKEAFFCSVTDPYQPLEKKYQRTRALLEQLQNTGISLSFSTKSDLILRDLDLIKTFPGAHVSWSINTLDEDFRKEMDRAVSIERRLEAMRQFYEAGIKTTCFISPIFPGITNVIEIIERAKGQCNMVWLENLNLRGDYRKRKIQRHRENILNAVHFQANSSKSESTNTTIKGLIKVARGFRNLDNMIALIYLKCSDLLIPLNNRVQPSPEKRTAIRLKAAERRRKRVEAKRFPEVAV